MASKKTPMLDPSLVALVLFAYHAAALVKDAEAVAANWRNYQRNNSGANLVRLLLAEGVFIKDLGLAA